MIDKSKNIDTNPKPSAIVIGAGFTGLTAAYELAKKDFKVTIFEKESTVGGLAGSFMIHGQRLEKFYHHWFKNDKYVMELVEELESEENVIFRATNTGMYYANKVFRLSNPVDVLKFDALSLISRIRLGLLATWVRLIRNWQKLENITAEDWLKKISGEEVFKVVWEPLLKGKFGIFASDVAAVWMWNKLKLRGGSRGKRGEEVLAYYKGGFAALADKLVEKLAELDVKVLTNAQVDSLNCDNEEITSIYSLNENYNCDAVIATPALPIIAELMKPHIPFEYYNDLNKINYLGNVCLILELDRNLSSLYWLNVNDPNFPFVGIIEHTNFEPIENYGNRHIIYLSKYLPSSDRLYKMNDQELLDFSLPYIKDMFPEFKEEWILGFHVWRARFAQPIIVKNYSELIPDVRTPIKNLYIATMAQIYPEDRGTNYAIRNGRRVAKLVESHLKTKKLPKNEKVARIDVEAH